MLELEKLIFQVDTSQLTEADTKLNNLAKTVSKVNKPITQLSDTSGDLGKNTESASSGVEKLDGKLSSVEKTGLKASTKLSILNGEVVQLSDGAVQLERKFKASDAAMLASLKVAGASAEQYQNLAKTLESINKLGGANSLDKSFGNIAKLNQDIKELNEVNKLVSQGFNLTREQFVGLARDIEAAKQVYSGTALDAEIKKITNETVQLSNTYNKLRDEANESAKAAKALAHADAQYASTFGPTRAMYEKATREAGKATEYLINAESRLDAALSAGNANLNERATDRLVAYQRALKASGVSADVAAAKFEIFKNKLDQVAAKERAEQLRYLSRAISVQMGDVAISLASGMNPLLVMIQQGDQIRGALDQTGAKGKELTTAMNAAAAQIATGFKNTAFAITSFMGGAFTAVTKVFTNFIAKNLAYRDALEKMNSVGEMTLRQQRLLKVAQLEMIQSYGSMAKIGIAGVVAALSVLALGYVSVIKEESALSKQLVMTGGSLALTKDQAVNFAKSLSETEGNTSKVIGVISEMAKTSSFASSEIAMVTKAALDLNKYGGVAIEDTVKSFAKMKDEPVKALFELAKTTGMVKPEVLALAQELENQGKVADLTALAMKTLGEVTSVQARTIQNDLHPLEQLLLDLKSAASSFFEYFKTATRGQNDFQVLKKNAENALAIYEAVGLGNSKAADYQRNVLAGLNKQLVRESEVGIEKQLQVQAAKDLEATQKIRLQSMSEIEKKQLEINKLQEEIKINSAMWGVNSEHVLVRQKMIAKLEEDIAKSRKKGKSTSGREIDPYAVYNSDLLAPQVAYERDYNDALELREKLLGKAEDKGKEYYGTLKRIQELQEGKFLSESEASQMVDLLNQGTKAYKDQQKAVEDLNNKLQEQRDYYTNAYNAIAVQNLELDFQKDLLYKSSSEQSKITAEQKHQVKVAEILNDLEKKRQEILEKFNHPQIIYEQNLAAQELADAQIAAAQRAYDHEKYLLSDQHLRYQAYADSVRGLFDGLADSIVNFAQTGKWSFSDMVNSMIADLTRLIMKQQMAGLANSIVGWMNTPSSIYSAIGQGTGTGEFDVTGMMMAKGGAFDSGIQAFAKGGTFTNSVVDTPTMFKFAKGTGLMGEAGPEAIMPLKRGTDGSLGVVAQGASGGSNVEVIINNNSSAQATASETTDARGNRRIEVTIGDMQAGEIQRSGSASQKAISNTFGMRPQLIRR